MPQVLVLGAGKIGSLIAGLLSAKGQYQVHLADLTLDAPKRLVDELSLSTVTPCALDVRRRDVVVTICHGPSVRGRHLQPAVLLQSNCGGNCASPSLHYFDLTEDVAVTDRVRAISEASDRAFIPQCGLAPGFISITTNELIGHFETVDSVKMRVGALPVHPSNALKYSLTWSTDGLINEYGNVCAGIESGQAVQLQPLEGYETIELDGLLYEAFNTSGGLGTLADTYRGRVRTMNYKTLRYPGHCEKIQFLMKDLKLNEDRDTLKRILERAIPQTCQDVVLIYAAVTGTRQGELFEETYVKKVYPRTMLGRLWSAIQVTTASSLCCVVDLVMANPDDYRGFVTQEHFQLQDIVNNRFGDCF